MAIVLDKANIGLAFNAAAGSTIALTTSQAVASGATIICSVGWFGAAQTLSSFSGGGLTWTIDKQGKGGSDGCAVVSAYATSGLASGSVLTATYSASVGGDRCIVGSSFTGIQSSLPGYGSVSNIPGTTTAWTTGNVTTTANGDMIYAASLADGQATTSTITSPSIEDYDSNDVGSNTSRTGAHRIEATAGTYTVAGTWGAVPDQLVIIGVAYKAASGAFPTTSVLDSFSGGDQNPVTTNWTTPLHSSDINMRILSGVLRSTAIGDASAYYDLATFGPNCEVYVTMPLITDDGQWQGVNLRIASAGGLFSGYAVLLFPAAGADTVQCYRYDAGVAAPIGSAITSQTFVNGDKLGASMVGNLLTVYRHNGTSWSSIGSTSDATYTGAGYIGIRISQGGNETATFDAFGGGTIGAATVPSAPQALQATGGNAQVALTWSPGSSGGSAITAYKIYRSTTSGAETLLASPAGTGTSYTDSTAVNGTPYFYEVSAVNAIGESVLSNEATATPAAAPTAPTAPQSLGATAGDSQVSLSWSVPASNGGSAITAYKIYRSLTTGAETLLASPAGTGLVYVDVTAANGTAYFYKVAAVNAVGTSALSNEASATPVAAAPAVGPPVRKRFCGPVLLGNTAATLYTCPASSIAVIRHIHVSNPSGAPVPFTFSIGASAAGTRLWDAIPLDPVDVVDHNHQHILAAGEVIQSFAGTAATLNLTVDGYEQTTGVVVIVVPGVPQGPSALPGDSQVTVNWNPPASNGGSTITGYKIYRSTSTGAETLLASPAGTGTTYTDLTTVNSTPYFYKVSAVNAVGESVLSSEVTATPVPAPIYPSDTLYPHN